MWQIIVIHTAIHIFRTKITVPNKIRTISLRVESERRPQPREGGIHRGTWERGRKKAPGKGNDNGGFDLDDSEDKFKKVYADK